MCLVFNTFSTHSFFVLNLSFVNFVLFSMCRTLSFMQAFFVLFDHDLVVVGCGVAVDLHCDGWVGVSEYAAYLCDGGVHF